MGRLQLLQETTAAKNSGLSSLASGIVHDFLRPGREPLWSYGQCGTIVTPQIFIPRCLIFFAVVLNIVSNIHICIYIYNCVCNIYIDIDIFFSLIGEYSMDLDEKIKAYLGG